MVDDGGLGLYRGGRVDRICTICMLIVRLDRWR